MRDPSDKETAIRAAQLEVSPEERGVRLGGLEQDVHDFFADHLRAVVSAESMERMDVWQAVQLLFGNFMDVLRSVAAGDTAPGRLVLNELDEFMLPRDLDTEARRIVLESCIDHGVSTGQTEQILRSMRNTTRPGAALPRLLEIYLRACHIPFVE